MALFAFILYLIVIAAIGLVAYLHRKDHRDDYLLAGRDHGVWLSALSASASSESGWVTLGLVGTGYSEGYSCFWLLPGCLAGYLVNWLVIGPEVNALARNSGAQTVPQLLAVRFRAGGRPMSRAVQVAGALAILIFLVFYVAAQFTAGGKALHGMFTWPYQVGVVVTAMLVISYSVAGGLRAISWTDVAQATLMVLALVFIPIYMAVLSANQPAVDMQMKPEEQAAFFGAFAGKAGFACLGMVIGWLGIGLGYPGQPHVLRRFMAAESKKVFRSAAVIALVWSQLAFAGAITFGILARRAAVIVSDPEQTLPIVATELLPGFLAGLVFAAVFSAICSTADSQLLEASASVTDDLFGRRNEPLSPSGTATDKAPRHGSRTRWAVVGVGFASMMMAMTESKVVFWFVLYAWAALGAGIGAVLLMATIWRRCSSTGALAGLIAGPLSVVLWKSIYDLSNTLYELVPAFLLSVLAIVLGSLLVPDRRTGP